VDPVKVNLGSGLVVAEGWINVDGSLNALLSTWPTILLKRLYRFSDVHQWYSRADYIKILKENVFVHHRLDYGVPFESESIDFLYSSHMLEHLFPEDATLLVSDMYRALRKGGRLRLAVPDLEHAVRLYENGQKETALRYFFIPSRSELFDQHHYMYDFDLLKRLLESVGFREIERCSFQVGKVPDIQKLDNRPEETLFVEARK
jgi:predicted SAM-dependent methyltransferase